MNLKNLIVINVLLVSFSLMISAVHEKVLETLLLKDTKVVEGYFFEGEFDVLFAGKYPLSLSFEREKPELEKVFGKFACWNTTKNIPCGTYKNYEILWVISSDDGDEITGKSTPLIRQGGSLGRTWDVGIGLPVLKSKHYKIEVSFITDLSELSHLTPKIKIHPIGSGKSLPSALTSFIELAYIFSIFVFYPLIVIISLLILYRSIPRLYQVIKAGQCSFPDKKNTKI